MVYFILPTDDASYNICIECLDQICETHAFIQKCKRSAATFRQLHNSRVLMKKLKSKTEFEESVFPVDIEDLKLAIKDEFEQMEYSTIEYCDYNELLDCDVTKDCADELESDDEEIGDDYVECPACLDAFRLVSVLRHHLIQVHTNENSCIMCDNEYFEDIWKHTKIHVPKRHVCNECGMQFVRECNLRQHLTMHLPVGCRHCHQRFASEEEFKHHFRAMHNFPCDVCFKPFTSRQKLLRHSKIHDKRELQQSRESDTKKLQCDVCLKYFPYQSRLTDHQKVHTGVRPFECALCGQTFRFDRNLRRHLLSHEKEVTFKGYPFSIHTNRAEELTTFETFACFNQNV